MTQLEITEDHNTIRSILARANALDVADKVLFAVNGVKEDDLDRPLETKDELFVHPAVPGG